jgi:hypothetical protein
VPWSQPQSQHPWAVPLAQPGLALARPLTTHQSSTLPDTWNCIAVILSKDGSLLQNSRSPYQQSNTDQQMSFRSR